MWMTSDIPTPPPETTRFVEMGKKGGAQRVADIGAEGFAELGRKGKQGFTVMPPERLEEVGRSGGQATAAKGDTHPAAKVTPELVKEIRARYAAGGTSYSKLAQEYGLHHNTVSDIVRRNTWQHID